MTVLLALSSPEYLRFYDDTIVELARRGHTVIVAVHTIREGKPVRLDHLDSAHGNITIAGVVPPRADRWVPLVRAIRGTMDYLRYLHPRLASARALRARARRQALPWVLARLDRAAAWDPMRVAAWMDRLARLERLVPVARETSAFLERLRPDVVLVSPLVELVSDQVDIVRSARALGIPSGTLVASWDNLTNKGDLRVATDRVLVWNEAQRAEAVELHRVPPSAVVVTGAPVFDRWFGRTPRLDRAAFCRQVGLPSTRPFVLFTGSSIFIARAEAEIPFIRRWIAALRASANPAVRTLQVLVRPHPYNGRAWDPEAFSDLAGVALWPRGGYDPVDEASRAGLFDSLYHAAAVVGINTSAMIEAAIVGRPVLSMLAPEFAHTQRGTLHFEHLLPENGGFLRIAESFDAHVRQLGDVLAQPEGVRAELAGFVRAFIRPRGVEQPATPHLVSAIEQLGTGRAAAPAPAVQVGRLPSAVLLPAAILARWCRPPAERKGRFVRAVRDIRTRTGRTRRQAGRAAARPGRVIAALARETGRQGRRASGRVMRRGLVQPVRRVWRAVRLARYHAGVFARRLRGVPIE